MTTIVLVKTKKAVTTEQQQCFCHLKKLKDSEFHKLNLTGGAQEIFFVLRQLISFYLSIK
jgi:hypothetical protein